MNSVTHSKEKQIRNSFIYLMEMSVVVLLPLITIPIFTRILTPKDYGVLALATIYAIFMSGLANFGLIAVFERNYSQYRENNVKKSQLLYSCLVFILVNFTLLAGVTIFFKEIISVFLTSSNQNGTLILTVFAGTFFFSTGSAIFYSYFKLEEMAKTYSKYRIVASIVYYVFSLYFVVYLNIGVIGLALAQLITGFFLYFILFFVFLKNIPFMLNSQILLECLKISFPLTPQIFIGILNTQFDKYMIGILSTVAGVGVFHIGKNISNQIFTFMTAIENVFIPQVYKMMFNQHEDGSESIGSYLTPFIYISTAIALCTTLLSEELLTILTPRNYHDAIPIVSILGIYYGFLFFGKIPQLLYAKKSSLITILFIFSLCLNIGLNIPLIMKFGAIGAAWATMIAGLISGIVSLISAQYYYKICYEWRKLSWIMGTFLTGAITIASMYLLDFPYLWSLSTKVVFICIFIYLGVKYEYISKQNFKDLQFVFRSLVTR